LTETEALEAPPGAYWIETLQSELAAVVENKVPGPQYKPDETRITVSTSKRCERDFQKRFNELDIDWEIVENKLRSWSGQGVNLTIAVWFIYKESQPAAINKASKTGRGATKKQLAARDELIARQEASGTRPVWKEVYALFECSSVACPNQGFSCWRIPVNKKHYKLDSNIMDKLVDYAEEGHQLTRHDDVPDGIRELIYRHDEEETVRRTRKRKASDTSPVTIRLCCQGRHDDSSAHGSDGAKGGRQIKLKFPMQKDEAANPYCDWLCAQVSNPAWQQGYRLACKVSLEQGYDLERLYLAQDVETKMLIANGVKRGIAIQFVSKVPDWLDDICTNNA